MVLRIDGWHYRCMNQRNTDIAVLAAERIESSPETVHTLGSLAREVGASPSTLRRAFVLSYGMTPAAYVRAVRSGRMREALRAGHSVQSAGYGAGFGSDRAVYEHGTRSLGMAPSVYRRGGRGMLISWDTAESDLGRILVGVTNLGICATLFADTDAAAERALRAEFPEAVLERDPDRAAGHLAQVLKLLAGDSPAGDIPLDLVGTSFQREVWAELRRIPAGETATYAQVASRIGRPRAVRAVASACAGNHVAVAVPCHRVVRTDGTLGGYKWGIERKQSLLDGEREAH